MFPEIIDKNYGQDPERADELRRLAKEVFEKAAVGDEDAMRTLRQLSVLIRLDSDELRPI